MDNNLYEFMSRHLSHIMRHVKLGEIKEAKDHAVALQAFKPFVEVYPKLRRLENE